MLPTLAHQCRFCGHVNPDGAKYCNECGSQLNLKPCRLCDAINDVAAEHCHKCGAALPEQSAPAPAPVAAAAAPSGALARRQEAGLAFPVGDPDGIAGDSDDAGATDARPGASPYGRRPGVGMPVSRWAWIAAAFAAVGIAAYLAHSPDRVDDAGGASQAGPVAPARNDAAGGAAPALPAPPEATPSATSSSGASEQVPVDPGARGSSSITPEVGAGVSPAGVSSPASVGAALAPGASPGTQPSTQSTASPSAAQAGKAKAELKAKPKPKPKPKAKPKSQSAM